MRVLPAPLDPLDHQVRLNYELFIIIILISFYRGYYRLWRLFYPTPRHTGHSHRYVGLFWQYNYAHILLVDLSDFQSSSVATSLPATCANDNRKRKYAVDEDGEIETPDGEPALKKRKGSVDKKGMKQSYTF